MSLDTDRHARKVGSVKTFNVLAHLSSGFNKYYPPDYDGEKHKSLNAYRGWHHPSCHFPTLTASIGKHALGDRARKLDKGILITRFELPFNIWWCVSNYLFPSHHRSFVMSVEHATTTLAWGYATMQKRRKSGRTTPPRSTPFDANVTCVMAGSRFRRIPRFGPGSEPI